MRPFDQLTHFVGFDWASKHHDTLVVDKAGQIVMEFRLEDTAEGWHAFQQKMKAYPAIGVAIETSCGPAVERLLDAGYTVYPVNPVAAKFYRLRKAPTGVKSDDIDKWSLADALRTDGHAWRPLKPLDPLTQELRLLCRDEVALIEERTAISNQLRGALSEYYPAALQAFEDLNVPHAWAFVEQFPTPLALQQAGKRKWEKFLHVHKLARPETYTARLDIFSKATEFCGSKPTTAAKSLLAVSLVKLLRALHERLQLYRQRIDEIYNQHPDKHWFGTLPIPEGKTAPRLLAELGTDRERFSTPDALQCFAGTAPVRYQSGQQDVCYIRQACNKHMRFAIHWFAELSKLKCPWAKIYYEQKRKEGKTHACALRCLGKCWLKIIWKMWTTQTPYDPELHQRNQIKHGSWIIQLAGNAPAKAIP